MRQLQAELRKLKDQLAQALAFQVIDCGKDPAPGGPSVLMGKAELFIYITNVDNTLLKYFSFVLTWKKNSIYLRCSFSFSFSFFQIDFQVHPQTFNMVFFINQSLWMLFVCSENEMRRRGFVCFSFSFNMSFYTKCERMVLGQGIPQQYFTAFRCCCRRWLILTRP